MIPEIEHHFIGGVYFRKMSLPAGHRAVTHSHTYDHASVCSKGSGMVVRAGEMIAYKQGDIVEILAHVQHEIVAESDTEWICAHRIDEEVTDLDAVAVSLVESK